MYKCQQSQINHQKSLTILSILCGVSSLFVIFLSVPIYIYRIFAILITKLFRSDIFGSLDPLSSIFANDLLSGKPPRCNIVSTIIFTKRLTRKTLHNYILKHWINAISTDSGKLRYSKFQQYPVKWLGFWFWKQEQFNINNHVFFHENLGNNIVSEEDLDLFTEKLLNAPFKEKTSLWEIHMVYNYQNQALNESNEELSVLLMKTHHSLADGYSLLFAMIEGMMNHPLAELPVPRFPKRNIWKRFCYFLAFPCQAFKEYSLLLANEYYSCPWKIADDKKAWHQLFAKSDLIPIEKIKDIKNRTGVSFTSVLVSAISAGINDSLNKSWNVNDMTCLSPLPVTKHIKVHQKLVNEVTCAVFPIPTGDFDCSMERLAKCHLTIEQAKNSVIPHLMSVLIKLCGWNLACVTERLWPKNGLSTGLTNLPSLPFTLEIDDHKVLTCHFAAGTLQGNCGVGFMVFSYNGFIRLVVTAEEALLSRSELDALIKCCVKEIDTLLSLSASKNNISLRTDITEV